MDYIKEYLITYTDQLAFITVDNQILHSKKDIEFLKNIPIPVSVSSIAKEANKESIEKLPFESIIKGMIFVLGVDGVFKYNEQYKRFLSLTHEKIIEFVLYQGLKFANEEKYYDAVVYFRAALTFENNNLNALYNYGKCCKDIHDTSKDMDEKKAFKKEAVGIFEKLVLEYPDFSLAYYYLGFFYLNQKMFEKTYMTWNRFLELCDDNDKEEEIESRIRQMTDHVTYEKGYTCVLNGQFEKGLELLLPLEEKHTQWWNLLFFIGLAYRNTRAYEKAIEYYRKVMLIKPSQLDTLNELGLCYMSMDDFGNAEKYFKKAVLLNENDHEILSNLASVYINTGKYDEAEKYLEKAASLSPNDEIIRMWLNKLAEIRNNNQLN